MQERQLIARAQKGDKDALGVIIEFYYGDILAFLYRKVGCRQTAEDLTQETFLKFTQNLPYYKDKNKLKSYLFTIAVNSAGDYFRKYRYILPLEEITETEASGEKLEENIERKNLGEQIEKAVNLLDENQRNIVILRFYHDMKIKEIAEILSVPQSTVKTRLRRAMKKLGENLKGEMI